MNNFINLGDFGFFRRTLIRKFNITYCALYIYVEGEKEPYKFEFNDKDEVAVKSIDTLVEDLKRC